MTTGEEGNLSSPRIVRELLAKEGIRPRKSWGQHFLVDRNTLLKIIDSAGLTSEEGVLEIGAGLGTLTQALSERASQVIAVEIDPIMLRILHTTLTNCSNVSVVEGDFLRQRMDALLSPLEGKPVRVIANVPYYISSPILERLLEHKARFTRIALLVQKEFALRLSAAPTTEDYGSLSLFAQYHAQVKTEFIVSKNVFYPAPEVDSAMVTLTPLPSRLPPDEEKTFFACTRAAFAARRKTLSNALQSGLAGRFDKTQIAGSLSDAHIDPMRRGETLSLDEFMLLAQLLTQRKHPT